MCTKEERIYHVKEDICQSFHKQDLLHNCLKFALSMIKLNTEI